MIAAVVLAVAASVHGPGVAGQSTGQKEKWTAPRTSFGQPDLQGVWANNTAVPLERPKAFAGKATLTDAELADLKARVAKVLDGGDAVFGDDLINAALTGDTEFRSSDRDTGNYDQTWLEDRVLEHRTSLIVDPPDGRVPPLTDEARARNARRAADRKANPPTQIEALGNMTRCITMAVPNLFAGYNSYYDIVQSPTHVVLRMEMMHDARIIPLDGRPHIPSSLRQMQGDPRGRWEGDTLVVETTNFAPGFTFRGSTENLHLTERFRRADRDTLEYHVTINDPHTWTRPWTVLLRLQRKDAPLLEYACHEGNLGMAGILSAQQKAQ